MQRTTLNPWEWQYIKIVISSNM